MDAGLLDDIIYRLWQVREQKYSRTLPVTEEEIRKLIVTARDIFLKQPNLIELDPPIKICGDVHGQFLDLLRLFELGGTPPEYSYLFLGDYVDRGKQSLETICLLLAYKIRYPDKITLLRGNHETASISHIYGFFDECKRRYDVALWKLFTNCFNCMPIAALIAEKILCVHGGISPELTNLEQINNLPRPTDVPDYGLLCDLLWSDPDKSVVGWGKNYERGVSYTFGIDTVLNFLDRLDLDLICRAHQVVEDGYEFFAKKRLVTVFSAPNYCGKFNNAGAMLTVDNSLICSIQTINPIGTWGTAGAHGCRVLPAKGVWRTEWVMGWPHRMFSHVSCKQEKKMEGDRCFCSLYRTFLKSCALSTVSLAEADGWFQICRSRIKLPAMCRNLCT